MTFRESAAGSMLDNETSKFQNEILKKIDLHDKKHYVDTQHTDQDDAEMRDQNQGQPKYSKILKLENHHQRLSTVSSGFFTSRLSPLKRIEQNSELNRRLNRVKMGSRDVSYLREAQLKQSQQNTIRDDSPSKNIIVEEKDYTLLEKGGNIYPIITEQKVEFKQQRANSNVSIESQGSMNESIKIKQSINPLQSSKSLLKSSSLPQSGMMLYPLFIENYQKYKLDKKNRQVDQIQDDNELNVIFQQFQKRLFDYMENQTQHKLPLTFPVNQGMMQAFGMPSSRQQVEMLINWFDESLSNLMYLSLKSKDDTENEQKLLYQDNDFEKEAQRQLKKEKSQSNRIQELLEFTQRELLNQVSIQCQERGFLLQKVVNMRLGIQQDTINQLRYDKRQIHLKAKSNIFMLKEKHQKEIHDIESANMESKKSLMKLQDINVDLSGKIEQILKDLNDVKIKKKQFQKLNNHLIDSLIIKSNQLKAANSKFKFKINQVDDHENNPIIPVSHFSKKKTLKNLDRQSETNLDPNGLQAKAVAGISKKIWQSKSGSRLFKQTDNAELRQLQEQLKQRIASRVKKLLDDSGGIEEGDNSFISSEGFDNPDEQMTTQTRMMMKDNNEKVVEVDEEEKPKIEIQQKSRQKNLAEQTNHQQLYGQHTRKFERNGNNDFSTVEQLVVGKNAQLRSIDRNNVMVEPITPKLKQNTFQYSQFDSIKKKPQNNQQTQQYNHQISLFNQQTQKMDRESSFLRGIIQSQYTEKQVLSKSKSSESSRNFEDIGLQFPEDDILNESDFRSMQIEVKERPLIKIIKQGEDPETPKRKQNKFSKHKPDETPKNKQLVIDLNLEQFDNVEQLDVSQGGIVLVSMESSNDSQDHKKDMDDDNSNLRKQKEKEELKKFLEDNDDQNIENIQNEDFAIVQESDIEENEQYEKVNDKNMIFFNAKDSPLRENFEKQTTDAFKDRVGIIVNMILENINSDKMSKKQLLQLVVTNILKNEQDEIKTMVIEQIFGQDTVREGAYTTQTSRNDSPLIQRNELKNHGNYHLPSYLLSKPRDMGCQTDSLLAIDFLECGIYPAEIYKFDRKAERLHKYTFNKETDFEIIRKLEFIYNGPKPDPDADKKKKEKPMNPILEKLKEQTQGQKLEIERSNIILKELLYKIRELEEYVSTLEERKTQLEDQLDVNYKQKDRFVQQFDLWINSWHKGFVIGFERGMSSGYFKGAVESKDYGIQEGFQLGLKEGWSFGFDDGFKNGVRKIYQEAKDKGLDVNILTPVLNTFLSQSEKRQGILQHIQQKLFKIGPFKQLGPLVRGFTQKFNSYNDKKKRNYAKLGLKTVIKMIRQFYAAKIQNKEYLLTEFIYDECQKKFGHSKMAKKAFIQFVASAYYHMNQHIKINLCCSFMHINEKPFSNEVTNFYVAVVDAIEKCNIGLKSEYDEKTDRESISLTKAVEVMKDKLEMMLPTEIILELRSRIEKLKIKGQKTRQQSIDLDKYMDFMIRSFIKFHVDLINKPQLIYFSYTLYEKNQMTYNELYITLEILGGDTLRMLNELREHIIISKRDLLKLFQEGCKEEETVVIRYQQFHEIIKDSDIFQTKAARDIFGKLPFRGPVQKFQEQFDIQAAQLKLYINEIYSSQEYLDRMEHVEQKEYWYDRIYAIERNIGEVNSTLLYLSQILVTESLKYMKNYRERIIKVMWEEKNGMKAPENVDVEQLIIHPNVGQFQEKNIKEHIKLKVEEITTNATPNFIKVKVTNLQTPNQSSKIQSNFNSTGSFFGIQTNKTNDNHHK